MNNTEILGKNFTEKLRDEATNFNNWVSVSTAILNAKKNFSNAIADVNGLDDSLTNLSKSTIKSVDIFEVDLAKEGIDVSEWEDDVKPVKAIMSVVTKDNEESFVVEIGNMAMLMEDGTFRTKE